MTNHVSSAILNPLLLLATGLLGFAGCKLLGVNPHIREGAVAAGACLVAAELALIPLWVTRAKSQAIVSQAALMSTVIHMLVAAAAGMGMASALGLGKPFTYWLLLFYWTTLAGVARGAVRAVRNAPIEAAHLPLQNAR